MAIPLWLKRILEHHRIPYEEHHHPAVCTASYLAHAEHASGHRVAKAVLLSAYDRPLAVVLPACARLDLERVRSVVGCPELRFASEAEIARWFKGCQPGTVPPLRLRADQGLLVDRSLAQLGKILFAAGTQEDAVSVCFRDWYRAVRPGVGRFAESGHGNGNGHGPPNVLIVEDEEDTNYLLRCLLERQGMTCRGALEGEQALAMASESPPAAVLLDLMLPDISGFEVYERLRRNRRCRRTPVIIVTALDDEATRQRGRQLGVDAFLTKPFEPERLLREVREALADAQV